MKSYSYSAAEVQARYEAMVKQLNEQLAELHRPKSQIQLEAEKGLIIEGEVNDQAHRSE